MAEEGGTSECDLAFGFQIPEIKLLPSNCERRQGTEAGDAVRQFSD